MKLRRWLAVIMSVMLVGSSFPVYASEENEEIEAETKEAVLTLEEKESGESDIEPDLNEETVERLEADTNEERITSASFETQEKADVETDIETNDETQIEEMEDIETERMEQTENEAIDVKAADDIASGTYSDITWVIDKDGKLTVTGTGEFGRLSEGFLTYRAPWYKNNESIISAEILVEDITDLSCMFLGCNNLVSINFNGLNTSNVTTMEGMFGGCTSLINVDVSGFDTKNVVSMYCMFDGCMSLTSVDVSGFDTKNVVSMGSMFDDCRNLTNVDVSSFDTQNVRDLEAMFFNCYNLTDVDVSRFNTGNVTKMWGMFNDCGNLTSIDVSSFDTQNVTDMSGMFEGCSSLTSVDVSSFDTQNVTDMSRMFKDCNLLERVDVNSFNTGNVTNVNSMFEGCSRLSSLDLSSFDFSNVVDVLDMFLRCSQLTSIQTPKNITIEIGLPGKLDYAWYYNETEITSLPQNLGYSVKIQSRMNGADSDDIASGTYENITWVIDKDGKLTVTGSGEFAGEGYWAPWYNFRNSILSAEIAIKDITDLSAMFKDCQNLTDIDMSKLDTSKVTSMTFMFSGCSNLPSVDMSGFDTSNVISMRCMFQDCYNLAGVDVTNFDTSNATGVQHMFIRCSKLESLDLSSFDLSSIEDEYADSMLSDCTNLNMIKTPKNLMVEIPLPNSNGYSWYYNRTKITSLPQNLSYSVEIKRIEDTPVSDNIASGTYENITWVIDKDGKLTATGSGEFRNETTGVWEAPWYDYRASILSAEIVIKNITNLKYMFNNCENLVSVDLKGLDTSKVTDMSYMFAFCKNLLSVDVSGFDTSKVTDMKGMFLECRNLADIDVSDFDTSKVTDMWDMFWGCEKLTNIDVSGFDISNVTRVAYMFRECKNLTNVDVSSFDTDNVWNMGGMFLGCENLINVDVSGFDTSNVIDMRYMFSGCKNLTNVDVSNFNTGNVETMECMFQDCDNLESIDISGFNTGKVTDMYGMFSGCKNLTSVNLSSFDTSKVTRIGFLFDGCSSLERLQTPKNVTVEILLPDSDGYSWYYNETKITSLPQNLDYSVEIKKIEDTPVADDIASGTYGNITWVIDANGKLTVTGTGEFSGETGTERALWYNNRDSITSAEVSVEGITNLSYMFYGCKNLISINLSGLDTGSAIDMEGMFKECSSLINVNLSSFDTKNVTNMWGMFEGCSSLSSVDVSGFHTENVTDMQRMFEGCSSLANVDVSNFDTGKVTTMWGMFEGCNSLTSIDISGFHTENVVDMAAMFYGCSSLAAINMNGLDTRNVKYMNYMFFNCSSLTNVNMNGFHTENVTSIGGMFEGCSCLTNLDVSSFDFGQVGGDSQNVFSGCEQLAVIQTPKNIVVEISLPGNGWYYGETEITLLPQNIGYSVEVKKKTGTEPEKPDNPVAPEITTTEIPRAVQNVPYEAVIQNNGLTAVSWQISAGKLPEGIDLGTDGVIYGVTKSTGKFKFTVTMMVNDTQATAEKTYTLTIQKSTDNAVDSVADPGYEIIQPIPNINIKNGITDQLFICNGSYAEFRNTYIDGDKLVRDVDYIAESGSTRITIKAETLGKLGTGKHTLGVEFRTNDGSLKRTAQNFKITNGNAKGSKGNSDDNNKDSSIQKIPVLTDDLGEMDEFILWEEPHPDQIDENGYYPVEMAFVSDKNAIMTPNQLQKYYGNTVYLLTHLGNGIGYSITATDINPELTALDLSAELEPLDDFADGFATLQVKILNEALLPYRIGLHVNVGTQYSGKVVYLFLYDKAKGAYVPIGATAVSENGNIMTPVDVIADIIIMIEQ